jgi:hypothetical protein
MNRRLLPIAVLLVLIAAPPAAAHFRPGNHNAVHAIQQVWCGRANVSCYESRRAVAVAKCEASAYYWYTLNRPTWAKNGQYLGMFQMGEGERKRWGHGPDPWSQARAAHAYWSYGEARGYDGWQPWQCLPTGGLRW